MCIRLLCNWALVTACGLSLPLAVPSAAADKPSQKEAVVEFTAAPGQPPTKYDMKIVVELVGTQEAIELDKVTIGAGSSAEALAIFGEGALEDYDVQCKREGNKVIVLGWKDSKTGKFYPVKRIKFISKTMPKEAMPKVTNPKDPIL